MLLTGNAKGKGLQDWVMESDGVNVKKLYFGDTSAFDGNFAIQIGDPVSLAPPSRSGEDYYNNLRTI